MKRLDYLRDLPAATDAANYRTGRLLSWMLIAFGGLSAFLIVMAALSGSQWPTRDEILSLSVALAMVLFVCAIGFLLIRKAKLGLWGLYFLTASMACSFVAEVVRAIFQQRGGPTLAMYLEFGELLLLLAVIEYFRRQRRLFTRLWGERG